MRTLGLIRRATPEPARDLWLRLHAHLRDQDDDLVRLSLPAVGWREAAALAAAVGVLAAVPEPLHFLTLAGIL